MCASSEATPKYTCDHRAELLRPPTHKGVWCCTHSISEDGEHGRKVALKTQLGGAMYASVMKRAALTSL